VVVGDFNAPLSPIHRSSKQMKQKKTIETNNETKSWFFEKINKIDRPLANLTK
jgi:hypothetical protein